MSTQILPPQPPQPQPSPPPPITCNEELFDQCNYYVRRHLYHATIIVTRDGYRYTNSEGQTMFDFAYRWRGLSGYGIDAAYDLVESRIRQKWISDRGALRINDANRGRVISDYHRHVQGHAPPYLADILDKNINNLRQLHMPPKANPVVWVAVNNPWAVKFRIAAIFHVAEQMRHYPFAASREFSPTWDTLNVEVIEVAYKRALSVTTNNWNGIFQGRYEMVYHKIRTILVAQVIGILRERINQRNDILLGVNPRTLTPTPPGSESGGSPRSVASGYDPTSDMDISPNRIGY